MVKEVEGEAEEVSVAGRAASACDCAIEIQEMTGE